jgi:Ca-activated chloride channel family protein
MSAVTGRKAVVVLSDGIDTGSDVSLNAAIGEMQSAGTMVYTLRYASPARYFLIGGAIAQAVSHGLDRMSRETGGMEFQNPGKKTADVFSRIESDLRNMYVLGFTPGADDRDGTFHKLEVRTSALGVTIRARSGYRAQGATPDR